MAKYKQILLSVFLELPLLAFAHGEKAAFTLILVLTIPILIILTLLIFAELSFAKKIILLIAYLAALSFAFYLVKDAPYDTNFYAINGALIFYPISVFGLVYWGLRSRKKISR